MGLRGSKTEENLLKSFVGESQARNRYTYFASRAKKEGFEQIAGVFLETADNEKEHAKVFFRYLEGGDLEIEGKFPAGTIGTTEENLKAAADGEHEEFSCVYPEFERIAREEGFGDVADSFKEIAVAEREHERRYRKLLENVESGRVFEKDDVVKWKCRNCGYVSEGKVALELCLACKHPRKYYELFVENY